MNASPTLSLKGDLSLETVADLYRQLTPKLSGENRCSRIDLGATGRIDSAGLALLLEWQAMALADDSPLCIQNAPDDLVRLARMSEATELLGLEEPDEETVESPSA